MSSPQQPLPPWEVLPTMYDLPSEYPEEPGLPDEFHHFQPQLLRETCQPSTYPPSQVFVGQDADGNWILTGDERAEQAQQKVEQVQQKANETSRTIALNGCRSRRRINHHWLRGSGN